MVFLFVSTDTVDACEILDQVIDCKHPIAFLGFQRVSTIHGGAGWRQGRDGPIGATAASARCTDHPGFACSHGGQGNENGGRHTAGVILHG